MNNDLTTFNENIEQIKELFNALYHTKKITKIQLNSFLVSHRSNEKLITITNNNSQNIYINLDIPQVHTSLEEIAPIFIETFLIVKNVILEINDFKKDNANLFSTTLWEEF